MERSASVAQIERCKRQRLRRHFANSAGGMGGDDHVARADSAPGCARRREAALQGAGRYPDQAMQGAFADGLRIPGKSGIRGGGVASRPRAANAPVPTARRIAPADAPKKAELLEGSRARSEATERTSGAKCPQGAAPSGLCAERWRSEADAPEGNLPIVEKCAGAKRRGDSAKPNPKGAQASACGRTRRHSLRKGKHGWGEAVRTLWRQGKGTPYGDGNAARGDAHGTAHTTHA